MMLVSWMLAATLSQPAAAPPPPALPSTLNMDLGLAFPETGPILDQTLGSTRRLGEILMGPIRDFPQLLPGSKAPIELPYDNSKLLGDSMTKFDVGKSGIPTWKYRLEAGGNIRQGNVNSTNYTLKASADRQTEDSLLQLKANTLYNQLNDASSIQRHFASVAYDRYVSGRWLAYARTEAENDSARHILLRNISSVGLGYRFIDDATTRWVMRTGPTVTFLRTNPPGLPNQDTSQGGWLLESQCRRALGNHSRFEWDMTAYPNFASQQAFRIKNDVALLFPVGDAKNCWNWKIGLRHEYTDGPPPGTKPNDTEIYFSIIYASK